MPWECKAPNKNKTKLWEVGSKEGSSKFSRMVYLLSKICLNICKKLCTSCSTSCVYKNNIWLSLLSKTRASYKQTFGLLNWFAWVRMKFFMCNLIVSLEQKWVSLKWAFLDYNLLEISRFGSLFTNDLRYKSYCRPNWPFTTFRGNY